jgi:hypothetical protein
MTMILHGFDYSIPAAPVPVLGVCSSDDRSLYVPEKLVTRATAVTGLEMTSLR